MNKKIKIYGAGSIGNHLAFSSVYLKNSVEVVDSDPNALKRMKDQIYPSRYKKWNKKIKLTSKKNDTDFSHDFYFIGTPPNSRISILKKILESKLIPKGILIEKPITTSSSKNISELQKVVKKLISKKINIYCGYNHSVSHSFIYFLKELNNYKSNKILSIESNWNETTDGILSAHSWLPDIYSSYLGSYKDGGGSIHEHSHGLHLFIYLLNFLKLKLTGSYKKNQIINSSNNFRHDYLSNLQINGDNGIIYKINTDFYTYPAQKNIKIQFQNFRLEIHFSTFNNHDEVYLYSSDKIIKKVFKKTRKDDFTVEIKHILGISKISEYRDSPLNLKYGLNVMQFINKNF
tara:strand:- start:7567 stop:8607 length:1041 start_codon:yes stop_codon:yes gene_type:complete